MLITHLTAEAPFYFERKLDSRLVSNLQAQPPHVASIVILYTHIFMYAHMCVRVRVHWSSELNLRCHSCTLFLS